MELLEEKEMFKCMTKCEAFCSGRCEAASCVWVPNPESVGGETD